MPNSLYSKGLLKFIEGTPESKANKRRSASNKKDQPKQENLTFKQSIATQRETSSGEGSVLQSYYEKLKTNNDRSKKKKTQTQQLST